jgi:hypothetical protein
MASFSKTLLAFTDALEQKTTPSQLIERMTADLEEVQPLLEGEIGSMMTTLLVAKISSLLKAAERDIKKKGQAVADFAAFYRAASARIAASDSVNGKVIAAMADKEKIDVNLAMGILMAVYEFPGGGCSECSQTDCPSHPDHGDED